MYVAIRWWRLYPYMDKCGVQWWTELLHFVPIATWTTATKLAFCNTFSLIVFLFQFLLIELEGKTRFCFWPFSGQSHVRTTLNLCIILEVCLLIVLMTHCLCTTLVPTAIYHPLPFVTPFSSRHWCLHNLAALTWRLSLCIPYPRLGCCWLLPCFLGDPHSHCLWHQHAPGIIMMLGRSKNLLNLANPFSTYEMTFSFPEHTLRVC